MSDRIGKEQEMIYEICSCRFKRAKNGEWEPGIALNGGSIAVIDKHGKEVEEVWEIGQTGDFVLNMEWFFAGKSNT